MVFFKVHGQAILSQPQIVWNPFQRPGVEKFYFPVAIPSIHLKIKFKSNIILLRLRTPLMIVYHKVFQQ